MNKYITYAVAVVTAAFLAGCGTLPPQNTKTAEQAITDAAEIGTALDLSQRPNDLPYFIAAEQELYSIANSTNAVTASSIDALLVNAGQTNPVVNMSITLAIQLGNQYITSNMGTNAVAAQAVAGLVADGIAMSAHPLVMSLKAHKK
jgi:hypothetical protein